MACAIGSYEDFARKNILLYSFVYSQNSSFVRIISIRIKLSPWFSMMVYENPFIIFSNKNIKYLEYLLDNKFE